MIWLCVVEEEVPWLRLSNRFGQDDVIGTRAAMAHSAHREHDIPFYTTYKLTDSHQEVLIRGVSWRGAMQIDQYGLRGLFCHDILQLP